LRPPFPSAAEDGHQPAARFEALQGLEYMPVADVVRIRYAPFSRGAERRVHQYCRGVRLVGPEHIEEVVDLFGIGLGHILVTAAAQ
jgi:hypothetical protein